MAGLRTPRPRCHGRVLAILPTGQRSAPPPPTAANRQTCGLVARLALWPYRVRPGRGATQAILRTQVNNSLPLQSLIRANFDAGVAHEPLSCGMGVQAKAVVGCRGCLARILAGHCTRTGREHTRSLPTSSPTPRQPPGRRHRR